MSSVRIAEAFLPLRSVVYATDFSPCSHNAGLFAARIAALLSAKLFVAHAFTLSQPALEVETCNRQASQQRVELGDLLSKEAHLLGVDSIEPIPSLLEGDPQHAITQLAEVQEPSMIALGTHGRSRLERGIIGSVAERILRSTRWPAITVGPQVPELTSSTSPFRKILFATDFTPEAAIAAALVVNLAEAFGAEIDVLNVVQDEVIDEPAKLAEVRKQFFSVVKGIVPQHAQWLCDPKTFVATGGAHDCIIDQIKEGSIDLLVLSIRNTSHLSMEMRTSGVFQIIVDARCPVLTVRR